MNRTALLTTFFSISHPTYPAKANELVLVPGIHIGIGFGEKTTFVVGVDGRATYVFGDLNSCSYEGRQGFGAFAQVNWIVPDGGRVVAGLHGGSTIDVQSFDFEAGWTYYIRQNGRSGHGLQLGLIYSLGGYLDLLVVRANATFLAKRTEWDGLLGFGVHAGTFGLMSSCGLE